VDRDIISVAARMAVIISGGGPVTSIFIYTPAAAGLSIAWGLPDGTTARPATIADPADLTVPRTVKAKIADLARGTRTPPAIHGKRGRNRLTVLTWKKQLPSWAGRWNRKALNTCSPVRL
jgi:hypothetical protein